MKLQLQIESKIETYYEGQVRMVCHNVVAMAQYLDTMADVQRVFNNGLAQIKRVNTTLASTQYKAEIVENRLYIWHYNANGVIDRQVAIIEKIEK